MKEVGEEEDFFLEKAAAAAAAHLPESLDPLTLLQKEGKKLFTSFQGEQKSIVVKMLPEQVSDREGEGSCYRALEKKGGWMGTVFWYVCRLVCRYDSYAQ